MLPELAQILQASALQALASEVLFLHGPSALTEYAMGRLHIPNPKAGMDGGEMPEEPNPNDPQVYMDLGLVIQPVNGVIYPGASKDMECQGYFNTNRIGDLCDELSDTDGINTLICNFHTPGGAARGLAPASDALLMLKKRKPKMSVMSYVPALCASAGYYLAASTDEIHAAPSALVGSIGTIASLADSTGFWEKLGIKNHVFTDGALKSLGNARFGVTKAQKDYMNEQVAQVSAEFKGLVSARREGMKDEDMQGQVFEARRAPSALVDSARFADLAAFVAAGIG